jgi:hypothetical protein
MKATARKLPRRNSAEDYIVIPPAARDWELCAFPFSTRLQHVFAGRECRCWNDLNGLRFSGILRWRNVGRITAQQLMAVVHSVQQGDWGFGPKANLTDGPRNMQT